MNIYWYKCERIFIVKTAKCQIVKHMKVLVCPLNWGLGHATRCVPIIQQLLNEGHEPVIVADGFPLEFLKQTFPTLRTIVFPSYSVSYSTGKSQIGAILLSLPKIFWGIRREHIWLWHLLLSESFDQIISDNRFGMWNKNVHTIYITHQVMVKMPRTLKFLEYGVYLLHRAIIHRYNECWIPDNDLSDLSGDLSGQFPLPKNAKFIGAQSRFQGMLGIQSVTTYKVVAVISGVEPQRTIFEKKVRDKYKNQPFSTLIVAGQPTSLPCVQTCGNLTILPHVPDKELAAILKGATKIICRSGYSSIMDLVALDCLHKAELIPTPGQTEQEYLAFLHDIKMKKPPRK